MFTDAIMDMIENIFSLISNFAGESSALVSPMSTYNPQIFDWSKLILTNVVSPVAATILGLFALLELHRASLKMESMGSSNIPAEIIFKILFRVALAKMALDSLPIIMQAIYEVSTYLTTQIQTVIQITHLEQFDTAQYRAIVDELDLGQQIVQLITCFLINFIAWIATIVASIIVSARFIEIYLYFAVSPIPAATFLSDEHSSIGKNFLKNFAASCLQGTLIFIVLSFFPILLAGTFDGSETDVAKALGGALGFAVVLIISIFSTNKWSKAITGAS